MTNVAEVVKNIQVTARTILSLMESAPQEYQKLLKTTYEAGSFAIGLVPGGAIVTFVNTLISANNARASIQEAHDAFKGVPPQETRQQLERPYRAF